MTEYFSSPINTFGDDENTLVHRLKHFWDDDNTLVHRLKHFWDDDNTLLTLVLPSILLRVTYRFFT